MSNKIFFIPVFFLILGFLACGRQGKSNLSIPDGPIPQPMPQGTTNSGGIDPTNVGSIGFTPNPALQSIPKENVGCGQRQDAIGSVLSACTADLTESFEDLSPSCQQAYRNISSSMTDCNLFAQALNPFLSSCLGYLNYASATCQMAVNRIRK